MTFQANPYVYPLAPVLLLTIWLSFLLWRRRSTPGAKQLLILLLAVSLWTLSYILELLGADLPTKHFWAQVEYFGIATLPVAWVCFALHFTGQEWRITRNFWRLTLLLIVPVLTLVMVWTPVLQPLIWQSSYLDNSGAVLVMRSQYGYGFWGLVVFSYALYLYGSILLLQAAYQTHHRYRSQILTVLLAVFAPILGNTLYLSGINPLPGLDLSPYGFAISGLALTWAILKQNLMNILPIARSTIVENLQSAVVVLDQQARIVDINLPAATLFAVEARELIGQPFSRFSAMWPELEAALADNPVDGMQKVILRGGSGEQSWFRIRLSMLGNFTNQPIGQLITLLDITEEYQAKETLQKRLDELSTIHAITQTGAEAVDENALIEDATRIIGESLFPDNFGFMLLDQERGVLCIHPSYQGLPAEIKELFIPLGEGVTGKVAADGQPRFIADTNSTPEYIPAAEFMGSEICVPLKIFGEVIGVINAESTQAGAFRPEDERLLVTFANQLSTAIERLRSQAMERQQTQLLTRSNALIGALSNVATCLESTHDPDEVLAVLGSELAPLGFSCLVALFEPNPQQMVFRYTSLPSSAVRYFEKLSGQKMVSFRFSPEQMALLDKSIEHIHLMTIREGAVILAQILPNFTLEMVERIVNRIDKLADAMIAHLPLRVESGTLGVLWLMGSDLQDTDLPALSVFARQTAVALENARLHAAEYKRSQELEALRQASISLTSSLELPVILETILSHAIRLLQADNAAMFLYDGENLTYGAAQWADGQARQMPNPRKNGLTYLVARSGKPSILPDVNDHPLYQDWQWGGAMVSQPLLIGKHILGVMNVALDHPHQFSKEELRTLQLLADQAALALENARLFKEIQLLAITDGLTGLYTHRHFFDLAESEFARSLRFERPLTAIMLDVDHFKKVNDAYGHAVGDDVLRIIAQRLKTNLRRIDIIGRYGGEEFVLILPETDLTSALQAAERLLSSISNEAIIIKDTSLFVTISIGVATLSEHTTSVENLVNLADEALLQAKRKGRNQVIVANMDSRPG